MVAVTAYTACMDAPYAIEALGSPGIAQDRWLDDDSLAVAMAGAAGQLLLAVRSSSLLGGRELGSAGDALSQAFLSRALRFHRPDDAVLSEEAVDEVSRLDASRVWIIDPIDGTREYGEGREDWAVHVTLSIDGVPGPSAVALPALGLVMSSSDAVHLPAVTPVPLRIAVSRSRPPALATRVAERTGAELVALGSAGYKAMAVLRGTVHAYVHAGGQYEWDSAAPVGVALAHGLHASRIDGSRLAYNRRDPRLPDLVICRPELRERLLEALAAEN